MIYVCIPSYDEAPTVGLLLWKIRQVFAAFPREYQLLVLDDGSTDTTAEVLEPLRPGPAAHRHSPRRAAGLRRVGGGAAPAGGRAHRPPQARRGHPHARRLRPQPADHPRSRPPDRERRRPRGGRGAARGRALPRTGAGAPATRRRCCAAWCRCRACETSSPASPPSGWWPSATRSGARPDRLLRDRRLGGQRRALLAGRPLCPAGRDRGLGRAARPAAAGPSRPEPWETATRPLGGPPRAARLAGAAAGARARAPGARPRPRRSRRDAPLLLALALLQARARARRRPRRRLSVGRRARSSPTAPSSGMLSLGVGHARGGAASTPCAGSESFRFRFRLQGKTIVYSLDDVLESYVGTHDLISRRFVQDFVENDKPTQPAVRDLSRLGLLPEQGKPEHPAVAGRPARRRGVLLLRAGDAARGGQEVHLSTATSGKRRTR